MAYITFEFKKMMTMYSADILVDNLKKWKIATGTSVLIELEPGIHTIRASVPFKGNEIAVTSAQFEVKPNMSYKIIYKLASISGAGVLEIQELLNENYSIDANGRRVADKNAVTITKAKGPKNTTNIVILVMCALMLIGLLAASFPFLLYLLPSGNAAIDYVNEPFTITELDDDGTVRYQTSIESIKITSLENSGIGDIIVNFEIIGIVEGDDDLTVDVKCYDKNNFLLEQESLSSRVFEGEKFKVNDAIWVPKKTARLEFVKD